MNTNTIWFRLALTVAAIWLAISGYRAYLLYSELSAPPSYMSDEEKYPSCYGQKLVEGSKNFEWRNSTFEEIYSCKRQQDEFARKADAETPLWNKLWNERMAFSRFFYSGLLPMGALLLIVAFWSQIARAGSFYTNWLKNGKDGSPKA